MIKFIMEVIEIAKGEENAEFYEILRQLSNSINNTGWQERHSQQIDLIKKSRDDIYAKYQKYLTSL